MCTVSTALRGPLAPCVIHVYVFLCLQMHICCAVGNVDIARLLIEYEPDMNVKNFSGRNALGEARMHNNQAMIDFIDRYY
jgi:hypothetical protein